MRYTEDESDNLPELQNDGFRLKYQEPELKSKQREEKSIDLLDTSDVNGIYGSKVEKKLKEVKKSDGIYTYNDDGKLISIRVPKRYGQSLYENTDGIDISENKKSEI